MKSKRHILRTFLAVVPLAVAAMLAWAIFFRPPSAREITAALNATIIPKLLLRDTPYIEGANVVLEHLRKHHPEFARVRVATYLSEGTPGPSANNPYSTGRVTLELEDIPASQALFYIATMSNLRHAIRDGIIYFCPLSGSTGDLPPLPLVDRFSNHAHSVYWRVRDLFTR